MAISFLGGYSDEVLTATAGGHVLGSPLAASLTVRPGMESECFGAGLVDAVSLQ